MTGAELLINTLSDKRVIRAPELQKLREIAEAVESPKMVRMLDIHEHRLIALQRYLKHDPGCTWNKANVCCSCGLTLCLESK